MILKTLYRIPFVILTVALFMASCNNEGKSGKANTDKGHNFDSTSDTSGLDSPGAKDKKGSRLIAVETLTLSIQRFEHFFTANGSIEAVNEAYVSPETSGQIRKIYVIEGQRVARGQVLARLNSTIIENSIEEIRTQLELASIIYKKQEELWNKKIGSEVEYLTTKNNKEALEKKLKTMQAQLDMTVIKSPVSGIIDKVFQKEGELASPGMQLMQVVNLGELYVNTDVSEKYLPFVNEGEMARIIFPTYPDLELKVPVFLTGSVIHPQNRTFNVRFKVKNAGEKLKPNLLAIVELRDYEYDSALVVPSICIKQDMKGSYVYLAESSSQPVAVKRYVETGLSYQSNTMITNGLKAGEAVIVKGYSLVSNGSRLDIRNK